MGDFENFVKKLNELVNEYCPDWEEKGDAGVPIDTMKKWLSGQSVPNRKSLKAFVTALERKGKLPFYYRKVLFEMREKAALERDGRIGKKRKSRYKASQTRTQEAIPQARENILQKLYGTEALSRAKARPLEWIQEVHHEIMILIEANQAEKALVAIEHIASSSAVQDAPHYAALQIQVYIGICNLMVYRRLGLTAKALYVKQKLEKIIENGTALDNETLSLWYRAKGVIECYVEGDIRAALKSFKLAFQIMESANQEEIIAGLKIDLSLVLWELCDLAQAADLAEKAEKIATRIEDDLLLCRAYGSLALILLSQGHVQGAYAAVLKHLDLAMNVRNEKEIARATGNRGILLYHLGDYWSAIADLRADVERMSYRPTEGTVCAYVNISLCYVGLDDKKSAQEYGVIAWNITNEHHFDSMKIIALRALATCSDNANEACGYLNKALAMARERGKRLDEAACLLSLATLIEDGTIRQRLWNQGEVILREIGAKVWLEGASIHNPPRLPAMA